MFGIAILNSSPGDHQVKLVIYDVVVRNYTHITGNCISVVSSYMELTLVFYRLTLTLQTTYIIRDGDTSSAIWRGYLRYREWGWYFVAKMCYRQ